MKSLLLAHTLFFPSFGIAGYVLQDDYNPTTFFDMFNAYTGTDPTHGFVKFVDIPTGKSSGLMTSSGKSVKLAADSTNVTPGGRPSIRLESKATYSSGLIVADIAHMPGSICGAWPAFWTLGPNWPNNGEIDIIEGVNSGTSNSMTLHTSPGCSINSGGFQGLIRTANCDVNAPGQGDNVGCGISASGGNTYGDPFNSAGGGVYATEWTSSAISIYFFSRSSIPSDITAGAPNPANWGLPMAQFAGSCDIASSFKNHSIVFDTTFCGDWAGQSGVWAADPVCSKKASTCNDYVSNNPADFAGAYWEVNSVKVYQNNGAAVPKPSMSSALTSIPSASIVPPAASSAGVPVPVSSPATPASSPPAGGSASSASKRHGGHHTSVAAAMLEIAPSAVKKANVPKHRGRSATEVHSRHFRHMMAHRRNVHAH